jgi:hypothetical protein
MKKNKKEQIKRGIDKYPNIKACGISVRDIASSFNFKDHDSFRHSSKFPIYMSGLDRVLGRGIEVGKELAKREIVESLK